MYLPSQLFIGVLGYLLGQAKRHSLVRWSPRIDAVGYSTRTFVQISMACKRLWDLLVGFDHREL